MSSVVVSGSSDTGLSTRYYTAPSGQSMSGASFSLRSGDFGVRHTIRIVVDSTNQVAETNESDNTIIVSVYLPAPRPTSTIFALLCTIPEGSLVSRKTP
jgi:subtilase family serine protease